MNLRLLLSDLESDWVYFPWVIEKKHWDFNGAFLVAGCGSSAYTYCILLSLAAYDDLYPNRISVYYHNIDGSEIPPLVQSLLNNNRIKLYSYETSIHFSQLILDSGHNSESEEHYKREFHSWNISFEKAVLISDYRVYAPTSSNFNYSEGEIPAENLSGIAHYYQRLELLFHSFANDAGCRSVTILRTGQLIGAYDCNNILQSLINDIAQKEEISLICDRERYPSIYIGDFLRAVFWSCCLKEGYFLYNLATSNLTLAEVVFCLRNLKCSHATITLSMNSSSSYGIGLSTNRLTLDGWRPLVSPEDYLLYAFAYYRCPTKLFSYSDYCEDYKLKKIQSLLLDILLQIDLICKKHKIQYFLAGGTLLGAVRNQGFLPWDNDLDLMMTRKNYNRFIQIAEKELPKHLFLQAENFDPENHFYSKIRLNNTLLVTPFNSKFSRLHNGIFLDIFPQDQTADTLWIQKLHIAATIITRSMVFNKWGNTSITGDGSHSFSRRFFTVVKNCLPMHMLEKIQYKTIRLFEHKQRSQYLYDGMGQNTRKGAFPAYWLEEEEEILFENHLFPAPRYRHEYLEYLYGFNYQYPVSLIKRKQEHDIQLTDLGPYI